MSDSNTKYDILHYLLPAVRLAAQERAGGEPGNFSILITI
ncbi:hypothetical protein BRYFOR_08310 [Marvinbryantia formatexigens DSM 14469]|uniref:Uncharacterized protein n=1 Tax=Marvinbryantia formatexigens DSM 14469 TaxID=478749 RepID=C6LI39_9FIRM|nr:hypothetical protein BRYFOR_08310 [Marvinbryantia formatexigens DSM 14469]